MELNVVEQAAAKALIGLSEALGQFPDAHEIDATARSVLDVSVEERVSRASRVVCVRSERAATVRERSSGR